MRCLLLITLLLLLPPLLRAAEKFGPYAEPEFPVLTSTVDFTGWEKAGYAANNIAVRGLIIKLPHDLYVCFDQDLLRVAGIWQGEPGGRFLTETTIPAISYHIENKKSEPGQKDMPKPIGKPLMATGLMPGWILKAGNDVRPEDLKDPRPPGPDPAEPGRGPLPGTERRFLGYNTGGNSVRLYYRCGGSVIEDQFGSVLKNGKSAVVRQVVLLDGIPGDNLTANPTWRAAAAARANDGITLCAASGPAAIFTALESKTVEGANLIFSNGQSQWRITYSHLSTEARDFDTPNPETVGWNPDSWKNGVTADVHPGDAKETFHVDSIPLPVPNAWKRNVRPSGVCFDDMGSAWVCTIDGDVWTVEGLSGGVKAIWRRAASGLHEPQSIVFKKDDRSVYVFTRSGIVRLGRNLYFDPGMYENFCSAFTQTGETREYPMDMVAKPGGGFYIAKGGQMITRKSAQGGHVLEISADGRVVKDVCSGLRQPYLGIHPVSGLLTASDQQGHWTVATPIRYIRPGAYYGFEEAAPNPIPPEVEAPACWIPHEVNQSAAGQVWAVGAKMGALNDRLLHLMYYRPGILTAFLDPEKSQAGVVPTGLEFDFPLLKGAINPADGLLYVVGFRIWGTESEKMAGMARVRPSGQHSNIPEEVRAVPQGIHLRFARKPDPGSVRPEHFAASRWNYKRTSGYGSAHYKPDGTPGVETLPCLGAQLSADGLGVLVHLPDMKPAEQYRLDWRLTAAGAPVNSFTTLTLYSLKPFDSVAAGFDAAFERLPPPPPMAAAAREEPTPEAGRQLVNTLGCLACHSTDGKMEGMKGPTWKDLYGSENELISGKRVTADSAYLRESILKPAANVRKGFNNPDVGMPPYEGILSDSQADSIVLYLRSLSTR